MTETPPTVERLRLDVDEPRRVCRPGGPPVGGASPALIRSRLVGRVVDRAGGVEVRITASRSRPGPWRPLAEARVRSVPSALLWAQVRDGLGNKGPWEEVSAPGMGRGLVVRPETQPFTWARYCARSGPRAEIRRINHLWRETRSASGLVDRDLVRPPGSAMIWTYYAGQGLYPNWVHAATALNGLLARGSRGAAYRSAVAEVLAASRADRSPDGVVFRVNENHFQTPDDHRAPPWRDAMGGALILAALGPAISGDDRLERASALLYAREYLAGFGVDHDDGGLRWRGSRPGSWYLEYTYRTRSRVLNGFMQALVSLDRFRRQARSFSRSDVRWAPLSDQARRYTIAGARGLHHWLPAYDLGRGSTRYSLLSGPATEEYRTFHVMLLRKLAAIPYLPKTWRGRQRYYAIRWDR